jgi:hypothetical protein
MSLGLGWIPWINGLNDRIGTCDSGHGIHEMYRADSLMTLSRELSKCKLDLVGVQEVR